MNAIYGFFAQLMSLLISPFVALCNGNYAIAIFAFTIIINVLFLPANFKQQKASAQQARLRHKMEKLKKECGDDRRKFQEEQAKLMQESGTGMMSGCLPMLIRLPFFLGIYTAIRQPLTYIVKVGSDVIANATKAVEKLTGAELANSYYAETEIIRYSNQINVAGLEKVANYDFNFFGIDLTQTPHFSLDFASLEKADFLLWVIPLLSFVTSLLSAIITQNLQKRTNPAMAEAGAGMSGGCMLVFMPLFSLWIAFTVPGAVGFYWACSNFATMLIQVGMQLFYTPAMINAKQEATQMIKRRQYEKARIAETEEDAK